MKRGTARSAGLQTGIARERETSTDNAPSRHRECRAPQTENKRGQARSAGLRPASRGSAKPAPMTLRPASLSAAHRRRRTSAGTARSAGLRPASRGSAKPAPMTLHPASVSAVHHRPRTSAGTAGAPVSDRIARERETRADDAPSCQPECRAPQTENKREDALERRPPGSPPSGARHSGLQRRETPIANREEARGRLGTPTSGRHSGPQGRGGRNPNRSGWLPSRRIPLTARRRATAERRSPTGIARERETSSDDAPSCQRECCAPQTEKKRGDGLERRPLVGTAARSAAAAKTPIVGMTPYSARTPLGEMARQARERRPPVGTAARRAAAAHTPIVGMAPVSARTPNR